MNNPLYDNLFGKYLDAETVFIETTNDKVITHGGFVVMAARLTSVFKSLGLKKGDRIDDQPIASCNIGPLSKQIMDAYWHMHNEGKHRDPVKY